MTYSLLARPRIASDTTPHTVEYNLFIKSHLASRNEIYGLMWCNFGHATFEHPNKQNPRKPPCGCLDRLKTLTGYCWCLRATMKGVGIEQQKNRTGLVLAGERAAYRLNSTAASSVGLTIDFKSVETIFQP